MITPLDIQNKEFNRSFRGYKESEVDQFLDEIIDDYERLYRENIELKDKILVLNEQIKQYNNLEETLKETLIVAQSTADEVISAAREKAEIIIEDAERTCKKLIDDANEEVINIRKEYDYLMKEIFIFKTRYKSFIEAQLMTLDEFYSKIEKKDVNMKELTHENDNKIEDAKEEEKITDEAEVEVEVEESNMDENLDDLGA
ncbi:cell division initiation protein [Keratinibaculum paraultunense]|uniref:Cell division initiation protein n=1 Tax=Keratinibaculum paraultunense TaxID=1278232 RepID=A0A4R3KVP8_9FIRM|nr:DivIVA domain-containing protein [Keratinibaculum paraultunense]QQY78735.1 DivIVA domain-containing protein [Keratinibaculum paraultunense]TCS89587.1 cell division initiation protein [Keratinibaculum paraultunense]